MDDVSNTRSFGIMSFTMHLMQPSCQLYNDIEKSCRSQTLSQRKGDASLRRSGLETRFGFVTVLAIGFTFMHHIFGLFA